MNSKRRVSMLLMMAAMMMEPMEPMTPRQKVSESARPLIPKKDKAERLKNQGVQKYYYGENFVYARNQKNADKKAKKRGWI